MKKVFASVFLLIILFSGISKLDAQSIIDPFFPLKSTDVLFPEREREIPEYRYSPIDTVFWQEANRLIELKKYEDLIDSASDQYSEKSPDTEEGREAELAIARGFDKLNMKESASILLEKVIVNSLGTRLAERALSELSHVSQNRDYDFINLGESLLIENEFGPLHPEVQSFVSYHVTLYNLRHGFKKWAEKEKDKILTNSYWSFLYIYYAALGEVARDRIDSATLMLEELVAKTEPSDYIKSLAKRQLARLKFENGEFQAAYNLYTSLKDLPLREWGQVVLERAWSKYYLKDFAKSLGLLVALEAPMFLPSDNPERYILMMVIYKELCHYETVFETADKFKRRFGPTLKRIERLDNLNTDHAIGNLVLLKGRNQRIANVISQIEVEKEMLKSYRGSFFYKYVLGELSKKEARLRKFLESVIDKDSREIAQLIVSAEEQVAFLDYTSNLDSLRVVQRGSERVYEPEVIPHLTFDKIYWPIDSERWLDEFDDYTVIIKSKCDVITEVPRWDEGVPEEFE